ncbi:MAG: hypothetical protein HYY37_02725 [Candidatus Aenigmarchaeota archaeon]|nr:hypothetical protein [Candidatus Aenigmarchaeota archaeon]
MAKTSIQIESMTRDRLKSLGTMEDTYDSLIERLVTFYEEALKNDYLVETQHRIAKSGRFVELG